MKLKITIGIILALMLFSVTAYAGDFLSDENINMLDNVIHNASYVNATLFYQNGSLVLSNESILNVNSSVYWDGETSQTDLNVNSSVIWGTLNAISVWFKQVGTTLDINTTELNTTIDARNVIFNESMTTYVDVRDTIINDSATQYADNKFIVLANESNLNVNSSTFWGVFDSIGSFFSQVGTILGFNTTYFNRSYDQRYLMKDNESSLNVNSSNFWDALDSPLNISVVGTLDNLTVLGNITADILNALTNMFIGNEEVATLNDLTSGNITVTSIVQIRNDEASSVSAGVPMKFTGYISGINTQTAEKANNSATENHADCLVLGTIASGAIGDCVVQGQVTDADTNMWAVTDDIYLNATSGTLINYKPNVSCIQKLGMVLRSHASLGVLWVTGADRCNDVSNDIVITGNITANWFFGKLNWSWIQNKFITAVSTYFFMDGSTLKMNTTELNDTIDERVAIGGNYTAGLGIGIVGTNFSVEAGNGLEQEDDGLKVADAGINNTLLRWKTGQNSTINDGPTFDNVTISTKLNPLSNLTFGQSWMIPQGQLGCFDVSCNHYIYENSSGVLIIV